MSADAPLDIFSLPLFPLHHVLFPQIPLQLHIFEERYKAMINECIERNEPFGVVLIREGKEVGNPAVPFEIGCIARILAVKRLEDGRMHLLAAGEDRFRLLDYIEADLPYLIGRVERVEDTANSPSDLPEKTQNLSILFVRYLHLLADRAGLPVPELELPASPVDLSFCIASVAQMPQWVKQSLLEMTDTRTRILEETRLLREQIEELEQMQEAGETFPAEAVNELEEKVLIALPIDPQARHWQEFIHESRN